MWFSRRQFGFNECQIILRRKAEYELLNKELKVRSNKMINVRHDREDLDFEKTLKR